MYLCRMKKRVEEITPYDNGRSKKEQVRTMFDNIAGTYDLLNRSLSLGIDKRWRKRMIREIKRETVHDVLDVATGTADVAVQIASAISDARITGVDLSEQMLRIGREKVHKHGLADRIRLRQADAEQLPFDTASFDAVTVAFGVRNFEHLHRGLTEMHRVLRKDGRIFVLEFSRPRTFPVKQLFGLYFRYILPMAGRMASRDKRAYAYLFESATAFPERAAFAGILEGAGFREAKFYPLSFGICSLYIAKK